MHYKSWAFAIDPTIPTIIVPAGKTIGQRVSMSDVSIINVVLFKKGVSLIIP